MSRQSRLGHFFPLPNHRNPAPLRESPPIRSGPMNVLVFASRKGGSGKSTLTAHLAAHASKPSRRCVLIDADDQGSLSLWHKLRGTGEPALRSGARGVASVVEAVKN